MEISLWFFNHELFNKPSRKLLKDDAIATLFGYNKGKQLSRCKTRCARLEIVNKKQLREEAFEHYDRWQNLYNQTVLTAWRKEKYKMKWIAQLSLCSGHHYWFYWVNVLLVLPKWNWFKRLEVLCSQ